MPALVEPAFLTSEETTKLLGLGKSTLAKMRMRGDGPRYVRWGIAVRYPRDGATA